MATYILYKTTNLINGNYYIGYHKQKDGYLPYDFDGYLGSGTRLKNAINKYGRDNFIRETLYTFNDKDIASKAEQEYITEEMIKSEQCYNIGMGGQGGDIKSVEAKRILSENMKGDKNIIHKIAIDDEWLRKVSEGTKKGQERSEKYKLSKIKNIERLKSDRNPAKNKSEETRRKLSEAKKGKSGLKGELHPMYGKSISTEHKNAISKASVQTRLNEPTYYCESCDRYIKTNGNWFKHLKSKLHNKN